MEYRNIAKIRSIDSLVERNSSRKAGSFTRLWTQLWAEIGNGFRKTASCEEMDESQLQQKAEEELAIAKAWGM